MNKKLVLSRSLQGSYDDDDHYYLLFDEQTKEYSIEHSWHYFRPNGVDRGESVLTLEETKKSEPEVYEKALEMIQNNDLLVE